MINAKRIATILVSMGLLIIMTGCHPRVMRHVGRAALVGAVVAGSAVAVAAHHAHHHHARCGHHRQHHHGRWVYHSEGHWEYYDPDDDRWYRYED